MIVLGIDLGAEIFRAASFLFDIALDIFWKICYHIIDRKLIT